MKKNGFVLIETIVVISVLCTILVVLYASFSNILNKVQKKALYDNTEYIYKTEIIRDYLESQLDESVYTQMYTIYCQNSDTSNRCYSDEIMGSYSNSLFKFLGVEGIYFTVWNTYDIVGQISGFEPTTQNYIKFLDPDEQAGYRIIVMYKQENNDTDRSIYEYASLKIGSRN